MTMIQKMGEESAVVDRQPAWWSWLLGTWARKHVRIHSPLSREDSIGRIQAICTNTHLSPPGRLSTYTDQGILLQGVVKPSGWVWVAALTTYINGWRPRFRGDVEQIPAGSEIRGQVAVSLPVRAFTAVMLLFASFITLVLLSAEQWVGAAITAGFLAVLCAFVSGARYVARAEGAAITEALRSAVDGQDTSKGCHLSPG